MSVSRESVEFSCALFAKYIVDHTSITLVCRVLQFLLFNPTSRLLGTADGEELQTYNKQNCTLSIPPYLQP